MKAKRFILIITIVLALFSFGCGNSVQTKEGAAAPIPQSEDAKAQTAQVPLLDCPFSSLGWDSTVEDMTAAEGSDYATYDSVYGGICYTYPKEYEGQDGTIKYMFNEKEQLMCVAWAYGCEDTDQLHSLYEQINTALIAKHGEGGYQANHAQAGNYGNVWYLEEGDIVLSTMITSSNKALQYAYLHPQVSGPAKKKGE